MLIFRGILQFALIHGDLIAGRAVRIEITCDRFSAHVGTPAGRNYAGFIAVHLIGLLIGKFPCDFYGRPKRTTGLPNINIGVIADIVVAVIAVDRGIPGKLNDGGTIYMNGIAISVGPCRVAADRAA